MGIFIPVKLWFYFLKPKTMQHFSKVFFFLHIFWQRTLNFCRRKKCMLMYCLPFLFSSLIFEPSYVESTTEQKLECTFLPRFSFLQINEEYITIREFNDLLGQSMHIYCFPKVCFPSPISILFLQPKLAFRLNGMKQKNSSNYTL